MSNPKLQDLGNDLIYPIYKTNMSKVYEFIISFRIEVMYALLIQFGILLILKNCKTRKKNSSMMSGHAFYRN
jgi:hypothetical protein